MKPDIPRLRAWAAALRSGQYTQCRLSLRDRNGFCPIGVACDLVDPKGWSFGSRHRFVFRRHGASAPPSVNEYYGMNIDVDFPNIPFGSIRAWGDHDGPFTAIANFIDAFCDAYVALDYAA